MTLVILPLVLASARIFLKFKSWNVWSMFFMEDLSKFPFRFLEANIYLLAQISCHSNSHINGVRMHQITRSVGSSEGPFSPRRVRVLYSCISFDVFSCCTYITAIGLAVEVASVTWHVNGYRRCTQRCTIHQGTQFNAKCVVDKRHLPSKKQTEWVTDRN
jgi:hypothetical protein